MSPDEMKSDAARAALEHVQDGMRLGLGTGSTARFFVALLAERARDGLNVVCVPTSEETRRQAESLGLVLTTLDEAPELDLCVDGADEIGPDLALIKGGGGALLREKIVAFAARSVIIIADDSKMVARLGAVPLPVEVVSFGLGATRRAIGRLAEKLGLPDDIHLRARPDGHVFVTDGGHSILDCKFRRIDDPAALAAGLAAIPGVVEHGLFLNLARMACVASASGVRTLTSTLQ